VEGVRLAVVDVEAGGGMVQRRGSLDEAVRAVVDEAGCEVAAA
jgi:hypothetical protein